MDEDFSNLTPELQKKQIESKAKELGFEVFGVTSVPVDLRREYYYEWLKEGQHGEMQWMARDPERRTHPEQVQPEAKSILCLGLNYYQPEPKRRGRISKYCLGADYHKVIIKKLKSICRELQAAGFANRPYVDTGPLLEKPIAALAGLGWQGKNTILLNAEQGQWLFLGFILTTLELPEDKPVADRCGTCSKCIDVCPTQAITAPYQLDARKCISYLTIEHKGSIPEEFRKPIGNHLFGCDDCLDVCPWNRWAKATREAKFQPREYPDLQEMLEWDESTFLEIMAGTPMRRTGHSRWLRNVAVVLGNTGTPDDLPALHKATQSGDALIAEHAAWAIEQIKKRFPQDNTDPDEPETQVLEIDGTLDLHMFHPKDTKALVLEYIDACLEKEIYSVRIIHGKGMGVLRTQVHALLDRHPKVESYQLAPGNQGHWGATIAKLKAPENS